MFIFLDLGAGAGGRSINEYGNDTGPTKDFWDIFLTDVKLLLLERLREVITPWKI